MSEYDNKCWYSSVCTQETCNPDYCIRYLEVKYLMDNSGLPVAKQRPIELFAPPEDLEAYKRLATIKANVLDFVADGENLYITSNATGNGKTSWAIKILLKYFDEIWAENGFKVRGMFVHTPTLLLSLKDFENPVQSSYKAQLRECDLVVWDDIASTGLTPYDYVQFIAIIDNRLLAEKANIFTSNISDRMKLSEMIGERLASRIYSASEVITLKGSDWREQNKDV